MRKPVALVATVMILLLPSALFSAEDTLPDRIQKAIDKGVAYLKSHQKGDGSWGGLQADKCGYTGKAIDREYNQAGICGLVLYALLKSGVDPRDPVVQKGFAFFEEGARRGVFDPLLLSSYEISMVILAFEALHNPYKKERVRAAVEGAKSGKPPKTARTNPVVLPPKDLKKMQDLVDALVDRRSPDAWRYNYDPHAPDPDLPFHQDLSSTQLAVIALRSASHCHGVRFDRSLLFSVVDFSLANQEADGPACVEDGANDATGVPVKARGFAYNVESASREEKIATGSMTTAGCTILLVAKTLLLEDRRFQKEYEAKVDRAIADGMAWLDRNWSVKENPRRRYYFFYYLYGVERVADLQDTFRIGNHLWYNEGAEALLADQDSCGAWLREDSGKPNDILNTSFALLFLDRATAPVVLTREK
jgi:hypothetical protein